MILLIIVAAASISMINYSLYSIRSNMLIDAVHYALGDGFVHRPHLEQLGGAEHAVVDLYVEAVEINNL